VRPDASAGPSTSPLAAVPQALSKVLLLLEAIPLLYLSLVAAFSFVAMFTSESLWRSPEWVGPAALHAVAIAAILAGWRLMLRFWVGGSQGLHTVNRMWWAIAYLGAAIACVAFAVLAVPGMLERRFHSPLVWEFQFLRFGVCFLLPLVQLQLEYSLRTTANNRWRGP